MGKSTISMAIFNSFLYVHQAGYICPDISVVGWDLSTKKHNWEAQLAQIWRKIQLIFVVNDSSMTEISERFTYLLEILDLLIEKYQDYW